MKRIIISAISLLAAAALGAQNLDPTVVVTNTYIQQAGAVEKPSQLMEMPDSITRFNLDFDYSALSMPYRGAYEFKPYLVELRPTNRPSTEGRLYLSGGAGYSFHPELTAVWTPVQKDYFKLNLYGDFKSYMGHYRNIAPVGDWFVADGSLWAGSRIRGVAGVNGLFTWSGGRLEADLGYRNVSAADCYVNKASFNALEFKIRVESNPDASLYYLVKNSETVLRAPSGQEIHSLTDAGIGTHFGGHYVKLGVVADIVSATSDYAGNISFVPRYIFNLGDFSLDLGARVSFMFRSAETFFAAANAPKGYKFPLFPDARVTYSVIPDALVLYARAKGGYVMNYYGSLIEDNPFISSFAGGLDVSIERINAGLGARGNIKSHFYYDLKLGYALRGNSLLWGLQPDGVTPAFGYAPSYSMFYTDLSLGWKGDYVDVDGCLLFQKTNMQQERLFAPAALQASASAVYKWGGRIRAGVCIEGRTESVALMGEGAVRGIPGYIDLGLMGDLQMTQTLGFWIKAGNLLNQTIQRVPFHAEKGIYFTVGARLNL